MLRKLFKEHSITNFGIEAELLYNANAKGGEELKNLLKRYYEIEKIYNNMRRLNLEPEKKERIKYDFNFVKKLLDEYGLKDIDNDGLIMRLSGYLKSKNKNNKVIEILFALGFIDKHGVTDVGKWIGIELQKNSRFNFINIKDKRDLNIYRKAFLNLYQKGKNISNELLRNEIYLINIGV